MKEDRKARETWERPSVVKMGAADAENGVMLMADQFASTRHPTS